MTWDIHLLLDTITAGLQRRAAMDDEEQIVYGFDSSAELQLHPLIQEALRQADYGVWPEQRYPDHWHKSRKSEGLRCDITLTPAPDGLPIRDPELKSTLFDQTPAVDAEDAFWLEIKTVAQYESSGPFRGYSRELLNPVTKDVMKLWQDGRIRHAAMLIVLFAESEAVAEHDLGAWEARCLKRKLPIQASMQRGFAITNRVGNGWCALGLFVVRQQ